MKTKKSNHCELEQMGLRLEPAMERYWLLVLLYLATLLSGATWLWMAVAGAPPFSRTVSSMAGRVCAGLLGVSALVAFFAARRFRGMR